MPKVGWLRKHVPPVFFVFYEFAWFIIFWLNSSWLKQLFEFWIYPGLQLKQVPVTGWYWAQGKESSTTHFVLSSYNL